VTTAKPFTIPKRLVYEAFEAVKANAGSAGVDKETIEDFETNLKDNLYRIWNRMSSGSYVPPRHRQLNGLGVGRWVRAGVCRLLAPPCIAAIAFLRK
jgi:RNA-directed DNA polymerase